MNGNQTFEYIESQTPYFDKKLKEDMCLYERDEYNEALKTKNELFQNKRNKIKERYLERFEEKKEAITRAKQGEEIRRGILADRAYIESLIEGKASTGVCWTYNKHGRSVEHQFEDRQIFVELTAILISEDSIDEKQSHLLTFSYHQERELRLKYNEKILLKSIKIEFNYSDNEEDREFTFGKIYQINKIVSTGNKKVDSRGKEEN